MDIWQCIAGGGEDEDSSVLESAKREAFEEAGIKPRLHYTVLDTFCSIPTNCFKNSIEIWGEDCPVIPEYYFAVQLEELDFSINREHVNYEWLNYDQAMRNLRYDSNKTPLWELDNRIKCCLYK